MKRFFLILLIIVLFTLLTSCDLLHTTDIERGSSYALIYGVADYSIINDLTYTYNDAEDMDRFLTEKNFNTTVRFDRDVTKSAIMADIESLIDNPDVDENTITVFFFAGHGDGYLREYPTDAVLDPPIFIVPEEYAGQPYLLPDILEFNNSHVIFATELLDKLSTIPGKKLIILDICFAGGFVRDNGIDIDGLPDDYGYTGNPPNFFQTWDTYLSEAYDTNYRDIWVIGSAGENELAYEDSSIKNGYYTYYLLESLGYDHDDFSIADTIPADKNSDKLITISEIYNETFNRFDQNYNDLLNSNYARYYSHTSGGPKDLILFDLTL